MCWSPTHCQALVKDCDWLNIVRMVWGKVVCMVCKRLLIINKMLYWSSLDLFLQLKWLFLLNSTEFQVPVLVQMGMVPNRSQEQSGYRLAMKSAEATWSCWNTVSVSTVKRVLQYHGLRCCPFCSPCSKSDIFRLYHSLQLTTWTKENIPKKNIPFVGMFYIQRQRLTCLATTWKTKDYCTKMLSMVVVA